MFRKAALYVSAILFGLSAIAAGVALANSFKEPDRDQVLGRPIAVADRPVAELTVKRIERQLGQSHEQLVQRVEVLSQRLDAALRTQDLLRGELEAHVKSSDARFAKQDQATAPPDPPASKPMIRGFTPTWFVCTACPRVKRESEAPDLPYVVEWSEIDEAALKALGIPSSARMPCFYWTDAQGRSWYFSNTETNRPTMDALTAFWRLHQ